jgi:CHAT domain-containing protein/lipopolysaccharide biosynthesis regulator YciM
VRTNLGYVAAHVLIAAMVMAVFPMGLRAQGADEIAALDKQIEHLYNEGKYAEATALAMKAQELSERLLGPDHPRTLLSLDNLGFVYFYQHRYTEVEPVWNRLLKARERAFGKEHPDTLNTLENLAQLYRFQERYEQSEALFKRVIEAKARALGKEDPKTLTSINRLAGLYWSQRRDDEAEPLAKFVLEIRHRVLGEDHPKTIESLTDLAETYRSRGRYGEAEPLYKRALEALERARGPEDFATLDAINNLGLLYDGQGRYGEAEQLFKRAIEASERVLGAEHQFTFTCVANLAATYDSEGRYNDAEPLFKRALDASERVLGAEHVFTLGVTNNLAVLYQHENRFDEAEPLVRRVLKVKERLFGKDNVDTLLTANNLAQLYGYQGRYNEAESLYKRTLEVFERVLGREHPNTLTVVNNLAQIYGTLGRIGHAEILFKRAFEARERVLGKDHPDTLFIANNLAALNFAYGNWAGAAEFWRLHNAAIAKRQLRAALDIGQAITAKKENDGNEEGREFFGLIKAVYRLAPEGRAPDANASRDMFESAQWAQSSEAARSLVQMASRGAKGDPVLAALVRERQDLATEWRKRDGLRNVALSQTADKRDAKAQVDNQAQLSEIEVRIAAIDKQLRVEFPDYAALASPVPLSVLEVQALLRPSEALVLFLDTPVLKPTPEETFIWVVTKTDVRWVRSELGTSALTREVAALRCGLDAATWENEPQKCHELTNSQPALDSAKRILRRTLPFDYARANKLYQALFGQVEDLIKGKQLLIVPSGPLTQLPFQVLVTAPPAGGDQKSAAWLIRDHALTVLPAVSSLKALRRVARPSTAKKPMIGFGNPLLDGDPESSSDRLRARRARDSQTCATPAPKEIADASEVHKGVSQLATRGGLADIAFIKGAAPLPETAGELCGVAEDVHADASDIYLGARATEHEIKKLSADGKLAQYRIVHFATHGALAGEVTGTAEPGLILTPPAEASEDDDGYLTASEIAGLKLDADWVILSACNTAAGGAQGAEALSGLARAFIYAQARALLVSHWAVNSAATVKLITGAMSRLAAGKSLGRAEAMRQSMLDLIDHGSPREAHPAYWAPFIVVGEGAR